VESWCEWISEQLKRESNRLVVVRARTEGVTSTATRRFEATPEGTRLTAEVAYAVDLPWPQKVLVPVIEFQWRRPGHQQLRRLLGTVKARVDAG
jgi:hypothetical protein